MNDLPRVIETEVLAEGSFFQLRKERLQFSKQADYDYYTLVGPACAVMVLATTPQNSYVLNWEYRHPVKQVLLSCPGGILHPSELPVECAARELLEETGFTAEQFEVIGESYPFPGVSTQKIVYVRAKNAILSGPQRLEHAELIETAIFTPEQLTEALQKQIPIDGLLLTALFLANLAKCSTI